MARPEKQPEEKRTERHNLRFTLAEHEHVREQAERAGLGVTEYLRRRSLGYEVPSAASRRLIDPGVLVELNRVGVNLNQIARNLNSGRTERLDLSAVLDELTGVLARLSALDLPEPGEPETRNEGGV